MLIISEKATISHLADIEDSVRESQVTIEAHVKIDSFVKIKPVGGSGNIKIGRNTYINSGVVIYSGNGVEIGSNVLISPNCTLAPVNHAYRSKGKKIVEQGFLSGKGGIVIEGDVWIGANSVILDGAVLREGCVVGANSLVNGLLESYGIYMGSPAVKVGLRK